MRLDPATFFRRFRGYEILVALDVVNRFDDGATILVDLLRGTVYLPTIRAYLPRAGPAFGDGPSERAADATGAKHARDTRTTSRAARHE